MFQYLGLSTRYAPSPITEINGKYYMDKMSDSLKNIINLNRREIGIPSLEDHIEKIKVSIKKW